MQKIFITGAEGFVGQYTVKAFRNDYSVIGLSRSTPLQSEPNIEYLIGDILDQKTIQKILTQYKPDIILHLAGIAKTWNNDSKEVFNINLFGTLNIYQSVLNVREESGYDPKIIFISSAEVYGKTTETQNITEDCLLYPINEYGSSKTAADRVSYQYAQANKLNIVILRPFPHIGPGQKPGFFVPDMVSQIMDLENNPEATELKVGNLEAIRDYLDVRDVVQAYKLVAETKLISGEVFNICSGVGIKMEEILNQLLKLTDKKITVVEDQSRLRSVDLPVFVGNNQKLVKKTGWKVQYPLNQTLEDIVKDWRNQSKQ